MPQDLTQCEEFVKQLQLCELVVARANSLRYKFQDALLKGTETDKDVEHFLSALMEKPEVTVIGAGRGPAGRVLHSLFVKQESARMQFGGDEPPFPYQQVAALEYVSRCSRVLLRDAIMDFKFGMQEQLSLS
ncbi:rab3 GTPase-activating protein catalytic subunit-like isoform X3 [Acropora millepora]|uniref:rab3 GTPase-activating protein catalytic subunit-like isoform X3 n=1 Tax=Acropora millepora TaxID=45264 RepID=UPI001CF37842|nr:rab3 GTPase-activating protein catalytic subunit-like isoform X3 [Acropora millepora]